MRRLHLLGWALVLFGTGCTASLRTTPFPVVASGTPVYEWQNGHWYNGTTFDVGTRFTVYGVVTSRRPVPVDSVIDLHGAYVVAGIVDSGAVRLRTQTTLDDGHEASFLVVPEMPLPDSVNLNASSLVVKQGRIIRRPE